jgi:hypothetical protein
VGGKALKLPVNVAVAGALFYSHTKIKQKSKLGGLGKGIKESKMPDNCE